MPQPHTPPYKPARMQSPGTAERRPSLQEELMSRERDRQAALAKKAATPPAKKGLIQTLRDRWAPVLSRRPTKK